MSCPICGGSDVTEISEGIIGMPNVSRPRGVFCNSCGRQSPDEIKLRSPGVGEFNVYEEET